MHRRFRLTPIPLATFAVFIALVGCGGAATPTASIAPATTPTAVPASPTTAPIFALSPTATVGAVASPTVVATTVPSVAATTSPVSASPPLPTVRPAIPAATNSVPPLGITDPAKWYNTTPLTLEGLRGKPVFLVFWSDI